tara:strand:+ start:5063 stop:5326 length:264 start_codon:yes stop_codon:yes gene_type:complete
MNNSELLNTHGNTPAPKPPSLTSKKINEAEEMRNQVEAFIAGGGSYTVIEGNTEARSMTAKEKVAACYDKAVEDGRKMDKPLKPKKR